MKYEKREEWFLDNDYILASIPRRLIAILIDILIIMLLFYLITLGSKLLGFEIKNLLWKNFRHVELEVMNMSTRNSNFFKIILAFIPTIYFTLTTYITNGQSIGKKILGIKIISIYHYRIGLWYCIERSLGYIASTLELGIGFMQIFWNPNRMALHDRIAETVVISYRTKKEKEIELKSTSDKSVGLVITL
jgi:uncharacterized RDD family membrane protein YckC